MLVLLGALAETAYPLLVLLRGLEVGDAIGDALCGCPDVLDPEDGEAVFVGGGAPLVGGLEEVDTLVVADGVPVVLAGFVVLVDYALTHIMYGGDGSIGRRSGTHKEEEEGGNG